MSTYFTYKIAYNFSWFQSWKWTPKLVFMLYYDAQIMEKVCVCVCAPGSQHTLKFELE